MWEVKHFLTCFLTQVPRITYSPPTFYFFLHRRPFFYERSGCISKNFFKKSFGSCEPPGNVFTILGSKKSFAHLKFHHHVWNFTQVASFLGTFQQIPKLWEHTFLPGINKRPRSGGGAPGKSFTILGRKIRILCIWK